MRLSDKASSQATLPEAFYVEEELCCSKIRNRKIPPAYSKLIRDSYLEGDQARSGAYSLTLLARCRQFLELILMLRITETAEIINLPIFHDSMAAR